MKALIKTAVGAAIFALAAVPTLAADITLEHAWSRATSPGAKVGAGYVMIKNAGTAADRLVSATAEVAGKVEIHEMKMVDGVMKMRPINGLDIPAGKNVELKPGGFHIMFEQLKQPLKAGDTVKGSLTFEKAGTLPIEYKVEAMKKGGGMSGDHMHH